MDISFLLRIVGIGLSLLILVIAPIIIGQVLGRKHILRSPEIVDAPISTVVGAAFATLAFLIAFIFQIAANHYTERKALLLDEVTNIRKTFLQSGLLSEPIRSDCRKLIVEYVDIRIGIATDTSRLNYALSHSQQILDKLWGYTEKLAVEDRSSEIYALFTTSVNDLVDIFNRRVTMTFEYRIPSVILWILFIVVFFTMLTLGYQFGISGKGSINISFVFAVIFVLIMFLIISLDRPESGFAPLNQKPVLDLQKQLHTMQSAGSY